MGKKLGLIAAALVAALLTGCPFEADTSLGEPSEPVDSRLIGVWSATDSDSDETAQIKVTRSNDLECLVEIPDDNGGEPTKLRVFMVRVGGEPFLNISEIKPNESERFVFGRYSFSDAGELSITLIDSKAVPGSLENDRQGLIDFLESHLKDPALMDTDGPLRLVPDRSH